MWRLVLFEFQLILNPSTYIFIWKSNRIKKDRGVTWRANRKKKKKKIGTQASSTCLDTMIHETIQYANVKHKMQSFGNRTISVVTSHKTASATRGTSIQFIIRSRCNKFLAKDAYLFVHKHSERAGWC